MSAESTSIVAARRQPGHEEAAAVGAGELEEAPEEGDLLSHADHRRRAALAQPVPAASGPRFRAHAASQGDRGERDDLISLAGGNLGPSGNGTV